MAGLERIFGLYKDKDLESRVETFVKLFGRAKPKGSIKIVSDNLDHRFYDDPRIIESLEKTIEKQVSIEIIYGPEMDFQTKELVRIWQEGKVQLWRLGRRPRSHFIVVDEKHVRYRGLSSSWAR